MAGYTKLFSSIVTSTIWCEDYPTRLVWVAMLAMADARGKVEGSVPGFARLANVTMAEMEKALEVFLAPDIHSRTPDNDGRRIEVIAGGWRILNYTAYRESRDPDVRREQNRVSQAKQREKSATSAKVSQESAQAEAEGEEEAVHLPPASAKIAEAPPQAQKVSGAMEPGPLPDTQGPKKVTTEAPGSTPGGGKGGSLPGMGEGGVVPIPQKSALGILDAPKRFQKPTPNEVGAYAQELGFRLDGKVFWDFYESKGWLIGKTPMKNWRAAVRTWKQRDAQGGPNGQGPRSGAAPIPGKYAHL